MTEKKQTDANEVQTRTVREQKGARPVGRVRRRSALPRSQADKEESIQAVKVKDPSESGRTTCHDADTAKWEDIMELCPKEAARFLSAFDRYELEFFDFAEYYWPGDGVDVLAREIQGLLPRSSGDSRGRARKAASGILAAWKALQAAFANATKVGPSDFLTLGIAYSDENGRVYFTVGGAYQLSPAGRKWQKILTRVHGVCTND